MESTPRTISIIVNDLEQRLKNLHTTRVHDDQTLNDLESLLNECSNQLNRVISSSDSTLVAILLPPLIHTIISLFKICSDKSDIIIPGAFLSRDKLNSLITLSKTLHNQMKEFIKSPKLITILTQSTQQRHFCEQLHLISDAFTNTDTLITVMCQKLIVKLLTDSDDQQQLSSIKIDDVNDGLILAVYGSVLRHMPNIGSYVRDKESLYIKMYGLCFQMLSRLIQYNNTLSEIENYNEFIHIMIEIHICLESTCKQNRFQIDFFNNTIQLQEILQIFILNSSKLFFDELFLELTSNKNKYASLVLLFRIIEAYDICLIKQSNDNNSIHLINQLIFHLFYLIDECRIQLVLSAILPTSFSKIQVEYGSLYDITYSFLMKLFNHESMQTVLSSMTKLIQLSDENSSILSTSNQLASELIIQSWFLYNQSLQFQYLFALFLGELLRLDIHSTLINYLLKMPNINTIKFRAYDALISSDVFHRIYDFFTDNYSKELLINSKNFSFIFPTNINHLYSFIRLFSIELNSNQIQHTIDTCIYSIQQFLSLPILTELTCQNFIIILRILNNLIINNNENFKCLLGQLTQIFIILDEQTALDIRLELLNVFTIHSNILDDNDLGRLLDFMLTNSIESNPNSIAFHIGCLNVLDSLRQKQSRSVNITDLIIQLIVRYGNEHQCSHILKAHLMRIFMGYISNGNDDSLPIKVKSQCVLLRASIDEFEKSKKAIGTTNQRFPDENILRIVDSTRPSMMTPTTRKDLIINEYDAQLKFYQTIVNELEFYQFSISTQNPNAMQQD